MALYSNDVRIEHQVKALVLERGHGGTFTVTPFPNLCPWCRQVNLLVEGEVNYSNVKPTMCLNNEYSKNIEINFDVFNENALLVFIAQALSFIEVSWFVMKSSVFLHCIIMSLHWNNWFSRWKNALTKTKGFQWGNLVFIETLRFSMEINNCSMNNRDFSWNIMLFNEQFDVSLKHKNCFLRFLTWYLFWNILGLTFELFLSARNRPIGVSISYTIFYLKKKIS